MDDPVSSAPLALDRDGFFRDILRELAGSLEDVVGLREAEGYISIVGGAMGERIDGEYRRALRVDRLDAAQVGQVLTDLKRRIGGAFRVVEQTPQRIVFAATACPFGEKVVGRPSLCMMTSNVFGFIAAANLGYARVELRETIGRGAAGCVVVVHLVPTDADGREYFAGDPADRGR